MFNPGELDEEQLKAIHDASIEKAIKFKLSELAENDPLRWQALTIKGDTDGMKADAVLKTEMVSMLETMGIEAFMKTPAPLLEQCIINGLAVGENPGAVLELSFRAMVVAYSHPSACATTRQTLAKLRALADEVMGQEACQCEACKAEREREPSNPAPVFH
ncbi:hypothetical protein [Halomonas casei]|uniref:hypothetical protein n=1 Tax=Halomonas casei TaxID=2742613 RepID=UPI003CFAEBA2